MELGTCPHQVLAAALTLSQPRRADYACPIMVSTPSFESHRHACITYFFLSLSLSFCMFPCSKGHFIRALVATLLYLKSSTYSEVRPGSSHQAISWTNIVIVLSLALNSTISSTLTELLIIIGHGFEGKLES